jgi:hypothetical protein
MQRLGQQAQGLSDRASDVVFSAMAKLDVPYRLGGNSRDTGFDCSGLVHAVYKQTLGLVLPRRAAEQASSTQKIAKDDLRPGDLVFFNTMRRSYSHVGIYIGDNKFIHAPRTGAHVRVENMDIRYWRSRFDGARRVMPAGDDAGPRLASAFAPSESDASGSTSSYQLTHSQSQPAEPQQIAIASSDSRSETARLALQLAAGNAADAGEASALLAPQADTAQAPAKPETTQRELAAAQPKADKRERQAKRGERSGKADAKQAQATKKSQAGKTAVKKSGAGVKTAKARTGRSA